MKRPVVGIPFNYDESWIGGAYYIKNLISSLNLLSPERQPDVWMISNAKESFDFIRDRSGYPRLNWIKYSDLKKNDVVRSTRRFPSWMFGKNRQPNPEFDLIFPYPIEGKYDISAAWIPDFQEKHLPDFFGVEELEAREAQHRFYIEHVDHIVFSSRAAENDFKKFYPGSGVKTHVVHFATFEEPSVRSDVKGILEKYGLPSEFFYCPNQFWVHKNHVTVIDAIKTLKDKGVNVTVVFSGKEHDHRAPDHINHLRARVEDLGLEENIFFLGFIPRDDQMVIFQSAISVVQPSLFEGWSTVIEDAKSVSQYVLASRIPANLEQADENIEFFDPKSPEELARLLEKYASTLPSRKALDYVKYQHDFAENFIKLVDEMVGARNAL